MKWSNYVFATCKSAFNNFLSDWKAYTCISIVSYFYFNNGPFQRVLFSHNNPLWIFLHSLLRCFLNLFMFGSWSFIILITFIDLLSASWKDLHLLLTYSSSATVLLLGWGFMEFTETSPDAPAHELRVKTCTVVRCGRHKTLVTGNLKFNSRMQYGMKSYLQNKTVSPPPPTRKE